MPDHITQHDQDRDTLARAMGYTKVARHRPGGPWWLKPDGSDFYSLDGSHPVPPTADAALAAFERLLGDGYKIEHREFHVNLPQWAYSLWWNEPGEGWQPAWGKNRTHIYVPDTGNFAADLTRLIVVALEATRKDTTP